LKVRGLYPYSWKFFLEARHHNVLISQDQENLKLLDIKDLELSFHSISLKETNIENSDFCFHMLEGYQNCPRPSAGPGAEAQVFNSTTHRGLVFIMSSLHINLGRGFPGFLGFPG